MNREQTIVRTSILGIVANVFLAAFKAGVGLLSNSVAIVLDAVNNLSDALSSLITIIGTKLAGRAPDKKHPLGHGRAEYLTATVIAVIILYAGVTSLVESIKKIISPETPEYTAVGLIIIAVAVAVKIFLGLYVKKVGKQVGSESLEASGSDAVFDSVISASTLVAAAIWLIFHVGLEAWLGAAISVIIIKSGVEMLRDTISEIIGERVDPDISRAVKAAIVSFPEVRGAYDLIIHNYGPNLLIASAHIEVADTMTAGELDVLEREITGKVLEETHVVLTGISVYSMNTRDDRTAAALQTVRDIVFSHPEILQMHGFFCDPEAKVLRFDMIVDFAADRVGVHQAVCDAVRAAFPGWKVDVTLDLDISD